VSVRWHGYRSRRDPLLLGEPMFGAGISVIGALIAIILLTLVMTELEIMSGIDPAPQIVRA
jgi:hypothetical protein